MECQMREQQGIQAARSAAKNKITIPLCSQSLVYSPVGGSRILIYLQEYAMALGEGRQYPLRDKLLKEVRLSLLLIQS